MSKGNKMVAKFAGTCGHCGEAIAVGTEIVYFADLARGKAWHTPCARAEVLRRRLWAVGLKELQGDLDELHWRAERVKLEAELAALTSVPA